MSAESFETSKKTLAEMQNAMHEKMHEMQKVDKISDDDWRELHQLTNVFTRVASGVLSEVEENPWKSKKFVDIEAPVKKNNFFKVVIKGEFH